MSRLPILKFIIKKSLDPYSEYTKLQSELDNIFDEFFGNWNSPAFSMVSGNYPKINVLEKKEIYEIVAATPGLSKEDLVVSFKNGVLSIKGESKQDEVNENEKYLCRELKKSSFLRSFRFDEKSIDENQISSSYVQGELRVIIPKKEKKDEKLLKIKIN